MKEFIWCREEVALDCYTWCSLPHAHICFRSPGASVKNPPCAGAKLFQDFWDLDKTVPEDPRFDKIFSVEQAHEVVEFVRQRSDDLFIVNCEAGISRSAGAVLAFRRHYGGDTEEVFKRAFPNIRVATMLGRILSPGKAFENPRPRAADNVNDFF